jgi:N-acyl-L-homoserine lactone synthetase
MLVSIRQGEGFDRTDSAVTGMFEDRKAQFVDLFGWDVPVAEGRFEIDQYDNAAAVYLIATDETRAHVGSLRLLPSVGPHILGDLFDGLCADAVPRGPTIYEITRLCLPSRLGAAGRRAVRDRLISAMVDHALASGFDTLTGVVAWSFLEQVTAMGWRCAALGKPRIVDGTRLGAFRIDLDAETPARLAATGIYRPDSPAPRDLMQAA